MAIGVEKVVVKQLVRKLSWNSTTNLPSSYPCPPSQTVVSSRTLTHQFLRIQASDDPTTKHIPTRIILTIDVSGSMGGHAVRLDDSDGASGLSQLDIVKHAARTIVWSLLDYDRLAVVAFSDNARVILPLTYMTQANKDVAFNKIGNLTPKHCAAIWIPIRNNETFTSQHLASDIPCRVAYFSIWLKKGGPCIPSFLMLLLLAPYLSILSPTSCLRHRQTGPLRN